jgi:ribose 5-phosphate isomerase B
MKIYLSTDHGGYEMKEAIKKHLTVKGIAVEDCGAFHFDPQDDYPDFILPMAEKVAANPGSLGVVLGRSGNGEAMGANKVKGIRCALCLTDEMVRKAREHNNANVLALGGDYIDRDTARRLVDIFLATPFSGDARHQRRMGKIAAYENQNPAAAPRG